MMAECHDRLNIVLCHICGDMIESEHQHDFKWCNCRNVAVDGGSAYLRRMYNTDEWSEIG